MTEHALLMVPCPELTMKAKAVKRFPVMELVRDMVPVMYAHNGVGLAAPQIGVHERVLVYYNDVGLQVLVNPVIYGLSQERPVLEEGCLSVPGKLVSVPRTSKIQVFAQRYDGTTIAFVAEGFEARVIQHEVDHLNGRLITHYQDA